PDGDRRAWRLDHYLGEWLPYICHRAAAPPCEASEDAPMHTAATWLELASHTRAIADGILDRAERCVILDVVADYERQAQEVFLCLEPTRLFGAYSSPIW